MARRTWTFTIDITMAARSKVKAQERLAKILNKKVVAGHKVLRLVNDYNGGTYHCPEVLEVKHGKTT